MYYKIEIHSTGRVVSKKATQEYYDNYKDGFWESWNISKGKGFTFYVTSSKTFARDKKKFYKILSKNIEKERKALDKKIAAVEKTWKTLENL